MRGNIERAVDPCLFCLMAEPLQDFAKVEAFMFANAVVGASCGEDSSHGADGDVAFLGELCGIDEVEVVFAGTELYFGVLGGGSILRDKI